ncbi:hypothetical protein WJX82_003026 [Trebouxia sp. C0006]
METRRSKRKEAAASESLPPEPRSKRARRAPSESKAKANTNTKAKPEIPSAGTSGSADPSTVQGPIPVVPTTTDSVPGPAPSEPAEASASTPDKAEDRKSDADLEKQMGARKDLAEAQERAAMEQERRAAELFGTAQAAGLGGLFSRLGDSLGGPLSSSKLKSIMASLKEDDEMVQEAALNELTELMSMSSEEALTVLPLEQLVPQLISLLNAEHNSQLMLLGARNLTLLADVLPTICSSIVRHGAVPALCARLMTIEYIDLAEQSLQALEKISHEHPAACLRHGGLLASLSYLDFFQTGVQRVAVATAANMCRSVTSENTDAVASAIPILTNLLQYQDAKVVDNACLALSRIAEAFAHRPASLNMLCEFGLISNAVQLISVSDTGSMTSQLSVSTYYGLVKLLSTCVTGSHTVAENLLQSGISDTLRNLLRSSTLFSTSTTNAVSVLRSSDQLHEVVTLACELLPPLPDASKVMLANLPSVPQIPQDCKVADESGSAAEKEDCLRTRFLQEHPETLQRFTSDLLPLLLQVYGSTVLDKVRNQCLATVTKIIHFSEPKALGEQLGDLPISSFIAGLLTQKDMTTVAKALQLAEILMHKLPGIFSKYFLKEGVVHAVEQLAASAPQLAGEEKAKSKAAKRASQRLKNKEKEEAKANKEGKPEASTLETDTPSAAANAAPKPNPSQSLQELLSLLQDQDSANISTFEFLTSGAVHQLRDFLAGADLMKGKTKVHVDSQKLLQRLHAFWEVAMAQGKDGAPPMQSLVSKLQSVLASLETFTVSEPTAPPRSAGLRFASGHSYGASRGYRSFGSGDGSSLSSGLAALTQPFKLRLARADHEKQLKDYAINVVLIEPLASMTAVEDFLWSKVYRSSASPPPSAVPTTASQPAAAGGAASAATNAAGQQAGLAAAELADTAPGSVMEEEDEDAMDEDMAEGPRPDYDMMQEEALAAASRSVEALQAAVAGSMNPGSMDSADQMEEDEEIDDEIDPEDEEEELASRQPTVHDVHVGGESALTAGVSGRDTLPNAPRSGLSQFVSGLVSTDAATAAAAQAAIAAVASADLAAAVAAGANRHRAQARVPVASTAAAATSSYAQATDATSAGQTKLRFYLAGKLVPSTFTIFQAVQLVQRQRQAEEEANAQGAGLQAEPADAVAAALAGRPQRRLWEDIYTISYSRYENMKDSVEQADSAMAGLAQLTLGAPPPNCRDPLKDSPLAELLYPALPQSLHAPTQVQDVLLVLKLLECINRCGAHLGSYEEGLKGRTDNSKKLVKHNQVGREEFTSNKLAPKLAQQLKDVLAICGGTLPSWCSQLLFSCKFLFPFDIRRRYFYCTAFGLARALHHLQQLQNAEGGGAPNVDREARELRVGRLTRQKVRVSRKNMLLSAEKVMETYASHRAVLELEYFGEVGTGLGPTLEFYTLLSHEMQRKGLAMWRSDTGKDSEAAAVQGTPEKPAAGADIKASNPDQPHVPALQSDIALDGQLQQFVTAPQGLFPAPLPPHLLADSKVLSHFKLLGRAMAKALQDNRLLDLPLSYVFYRKALGQPLDLYDIRKFDAALGATLEKLYAAHKAHQAQGASRKGPMLVDGCPIEDLCLTFVLPGYPEYELKKNGGDIMVDATNVGAYISAVVDANLESGIKTQMEHFRTGFNEVFPLDALKCFFEDEIEAMMCGTGEKWTVEALTDTIKFDHGYTASSTAIGYFLDILTELDAADQRRFLRFVTGSPRLPPGGIAALHPRLTVVRKHSSLTPEQAQSLGSSASPMAGSLGHQGSVSVLSDGDLPSVMTCANYIKLPPYSSKVVMKERVLYAIREGQGSFDLS